MQLLKNKSLSDMTKEAIIKMIREGSFLDNKLPAESKLAKQFGVSLPVVREALLMLQQEGIITKKHGSGNYFHASALDGIFRLNQFAGFVDLLQAMGYRADAKVLKLEVITPQQNIYHALRLEEGEPILLYERQIFADGTPVVHCKNYFSLQLFQKDYQEFFKKSRSIYEVIAKCFNKEYAYGIMQFIPYLTTQEDWDKIMVKAGQPIIVMAETYFTLEDEPIAYSINKFNHDFIPIHIMSR